MSDPPVLILDEATSSIDTRTEKLIEQGMDSLMAGRTVFVIAHRLSTVRNAQAILVLEQGRIIERGDHAELMAQKAGTISSAPARRSCPDPKNAGNSRRRASCGGCARIKRQKRRYRSDTAFLL